MSKLTKEEQEAQLEEWAWAAERYMTDVGCSRKADNQKPDTATTEEICDAIGISRSMWPAVRLKMIELDIPLGLQNFGGYYLGQPGEQWTFLQHEKAMIEGIVARLSEDVVTICRNGGTIDDVKERGNLMMKGQFDLEALPKIFSVLNCPLPKQIEIALLGEG